MRHDLHHVSQRLHLLPLASGLALAGVGYLPTKVLAGPGGVTAMLAGLGVVTAVVYATLVVGLHRMSGAPAARRFHEGLKVGVVRFALTIPLAGVVAWRGDVNQPVFLIWVGAAYVIMIQIETWALLQWSKALNAAGSTPWRG